MQHSIVTFSGKPVRRKLRVVLLDLVDTDTVAQVPLGFKYKLQQYLREPSVIFKVRYNKVVAFVRVGEDVYSGIPFYGIRTWTTYRRLDSFVLQDIFAIKPVLENKVLSEAAFIYFTSFAITLFAMFPSNAKISYHMIKVD